MMRTILRTLLTVALAFGGLSPVEAGFLYVLQDIPGQANKIHGYRVNESSGALTALGGFPIDSHATMGQGDGGTFAQRLAVDIPNNRLYVLNAGSNTVSAFSINNQTGALTALGHSPMALPAPSGTYSSLAVRPGGAPLVVGDSGGKIVSFKDPGNSATQAAGSPFAALGFPYSMAFSQNGQYLYAGGDAGTGTGEFQVDGTTGVLTPVNMAAFNSGDNFPVAYQTEAAGNRLLMAFSTAGKLAVQLINTADGSLSSATGNPFISGLNTARHAVYHLSGFYMVSDFISNQVGVYQLSGTGAASTLTPVPGSPFNVVDSTNQALGGTGTSTLELPPSGKFLFAANALTRNVARFQVDSTTGALSAGSLQPVNTLGSSGLLTGMVHAPGVPSVIAAVPNRSSVRGGSTITLIGNELDSLTQVRVGGIAVANLNIVNSTTATFTAPATTAGAKNIDGTANSQNFSLLTNGLLYVDEVTRNLTLGGGTTVSDFKMFGIPLVGGFDPSGPVGVPGLESGKPITRQFLSAKDFQDDTVARIFRFNGSSYDEGLNIPVEDFTAGLGFWGIFAPDDAGVGLNANFTGGDTNQLIMSGQDFSPNPPILVILHPGWNQISTGVHGVDIPASFISVTDGVNTFVATDAANTLTNRKFYAFTGNINNPYVEVTVLRGPQAYWHFNATNQALVLIIGNQGGSGGLGMPLIETGALNAFLKSEPANSSLPDSVKSALTGNSQGVFQAVTNADGNSPPAPPALSAPTGSVSGGGGGGAGGCFVATAAYGSSFSQQVQHLRIFRDRSLLTDKLGEAATRTYYANSPALANYIRGQALSRALVRTLLKPLATAARKSD